MIKKLFAALTAKWLITLIGAIILSLLVWFFGPLLAFAEFRPLWTEFARMITVLVIIVIWGLTNLFSVMRQKRSNDQMIEDMAEAADTGPSPDEMASADEVAQLKERAQDALVLLKKAKLGGKGGRQHLYQLPWYILIGPPGSGKTTALVNSGLRFPLADQLGKDEIRNVGGTRNCDWFFTDEAVLIDTAGRYTTQDSHQAVDSAAWGGFLDLLKKYRPRQPINGALIAISLADMAILTETERQAHARQIKLRIRELHESLGVRFPIYVLFTKADLIAGFVEFFDDFSREERDQAWGMTYELDEGKDDKGAVAAFTREFDLLLERLNDRMLERLHQEPDVQRRSLIYGFPAQIASLREPMRDFLTEIFKPSRYEERALLRGVYITSGTQEGTPIDRLMGAMASTFGLNRQSLSAFSGSGRSYFLTRLLRDVVFPEASIVSANRKVEMVRLWLQRGAYTAAIAVVLGMTALWINGYFANRSLIDEYEAGIRQYNEQLAGIPLNEVPDQRLLDVLPALETLRNLPGGYAREDEGAPILMTFGLYQGDRLGARSQAVYRRALNGLFLSRMLVRLEEQLRDRINEPNYVYEALKVYLILGGEGPMNEEQIRAWMAFDWGRALPGDDFAGTRAEMLAHLDALLEEPVTKIALDGPLVERARETLAGLLPSVRGYDLIRTSEAAQALPDWRLIDAGGPHAADVLIRLTPTALSEGVDGLYTYKGFHEVFLPSLGDVQEFIESENWVLGPQAEVVANEQQLARLRPDVLALYLDDYGNYWDSILSDIRVRELGTDLNLTAQVLNRLQGQSSPYRLVMTSIAEETTLVREPEEGEVVTQGLVERIGTELGRISSTATRVQNVAGGVELGETEEPGMPINVRFQELHDYVGKGDGTPAPIDETIAQFAALYGKVNNAVASPNPPLEMEKLVREGGTREIRNAAQSSPEPVGVILRDLAGSVEAVAGSNASAQLREIWRNQVQRKCLAAVGNRYPITRGSSIDVNLDDFTLVFGAGGLIDNFFNQHLASLVDTSRQPWRWSGQTQLDIPESVLVQFQRARMIRDSLFAAGGGPSASFEITPQRLDPLATRVFLEIDGQPMEYSHGPPIPTEMKWPGPGPAVSRISMAPQSIGQNSISVSGPWSFFRLLDEGDIERSSLTDRFSVTFNVGGRSASFNLRANSVFNPFNLTALRQFRCPQL